MNDHRPGVGTTPNADSVRRFLFEDAAVRGEIVRLDHSIKEILAQHFYPAPVAALLGEMLAASVLLSSTIKFSGTLSLQAKSSGPVGLIFAECSHDQRVRGFARVADEAMGEGISSLLRQGTLAITITPDTGQRYQGIVPLDADTLGGCLEHYFRQSEQLATAVWLASDGDNCAAGMILQTLPAAARDLPDQGRHWEHLHQLAATLSGEELLGDPFYRLLYTLFHDDRVRLHEPRPVRFGCRCSAVRAAATLKALGVAEARSIIEERGTILIHCEFCQQEYRFDAAEVERLFEAPPEDTMH